MKQVRRPQPRSTVGTLMRAVVAMLLASLLASVLAAGPAGAAGTGTVAGTVTAVESGGPVAGVTVTLHDHVFGVVLATTTTAADGSFSVSVPARRYKVRYLDPTGVRPTRWSGGATTFATATVVVVADGSTVAADVALPHRARVRGTATAADSGLPAPGIEVRLHDASGGVARTTTTAADGTWVLEGIADGTWAVSFVDPAAVLATTFWSSAPSFETATALALAEGSDVVLDQALVRAGSLRGQATMGGAPWPGVWAVVIDATDQVAALVETGPDGRWAAPLFPGSYRVGYWDPTGTSSRGLRPVVVPDHDAQVDLAAAVAAGQVFGVGVGGDVDTGSQRLVGRGCDPAVLFPGAVAKVTNLSNRDLRGCDLTGADLWGSNLIGSDLAGARITGTDLRRALGLTRSALLATQHDWTGTRLSGTGVDLSGVDFEAGRYGLAGADLAGLDLAGADLRGLDLRSTDLRGADLREARFADLVVSFPGTAWFPYYYEYGRLAQTYGTKVAGADLTDAVLTTNQARYLAKDWRGTTFTGTERVVSMHGLITYEDGCPCGGPFLDRPVGFGWVSDYVLFAAADLRTARLAGAVFVGAFSFRGVQLDGVDATGWVCRGCDLRTADLVGATIAGADLRDADLQGVTGTPAGGSSVQWAGATCPDGAVVDGTTVTTCVGRGIAA